MLKSLANARTKWTRRRRNSWTLRAVWDRIILLDPEADSSRCVRARSMLQREYADKFLILDIGSLKKSGCPPDIFDGQKLEFLGKPSLDVAVSVCRSLCAWLKGDPTNVAVICCADEHARMKLTVCALCALGVFREPAQAVQHFVNSTRSGWLDIGHPSRHLKPSVRRYFRDFLQIYNNNEKFTVPKVCLESVVIHKVPAITEMGCRLALTVTQGNKFIYTSMLQGGGVRWVQTARKRCSTHTVNVGRSVQGEIVVKAYHVPEKMRTHIPRLTIFELHAHTGALCGRQTLMFARHDIDAVSTSDSETYHRNFRIELVFSDREILPECIDSEEDEIEIEQKVEVEIPESPSIPDNEFSSSLRNSESSLSVCSLCMRELTDDVKDHLHVDGTDSVSSPPANVMQYHVFHHHEHQHRFVENKENLTESEQIDRDEQLARSLQHVLDDADSEETPSPSSSRPKHTDSSDSDSSSSSDGEHEEQEHGEEEEEGVGSLPVVFGPLTQEEADAAMARGLQIQFDAEQHRQRSSISSLRRAQESLPSHLDPAENDYEQLLALQEFIGMGHRRTRGASRSLIQSLPAFELSADSIYLRKKMNCTICRQRFQKGEVLTTLPCIHAYHKHCINQWLRINMKCPVCHTRIDTNV
eukprot:75691_1